MLKHVFVNHKKVPVPVPVHNVGEALEWVETVLLTKDHSITKFELDGNVYDPNDRKGAVADFPLKSASRLFVQVDSAHELAVQTIDAALNLVTVIDRNLKPLAVDLWQVTSETPDMGEFLEDLNLVQDLLDHVLGIVAGTPSAVNVANVVDELHRIRLSLNTAITDSNWKSVARLLLKKLQPKFEELSSELSSLLKAVFENRAG